MRLHEIKNDYMNAYYNVKRQLSDFTAALSHEAFDAGDLQRDLLKDIEYFEQRRNYLGEKFAKAIGGIPKADTKLNARICGVINEEGFRIEKVVFEARKGVFVTACLYVPDELTAPTGAVLFLSGHAKAAKSYKEYQKVCRHLVKAGLVVLAQDPVGQGERFSYYEKEINDSTVEWGVLEHDYAGVQCMLTGDSIARYFLHDAMRGVDYLCSRPEVDLARIGVTGNSGGGTQTSLMMLCDSRIAAAAPGTFIMNLRTFMNKAGVQDAEQIWEGMSALGFDHEDILLSLAPKPVLVLAVNYDFFPIEGTRETFRRAGRFWEMYGKARNFEMFADDSTHAYTEAMARKAADFFSRHLLEKPYRSEEAMNVLEENLLNCTNSGQVRGEIGGAVFVFEENLLRLKELEEAKAALTEKELREKSIDWLREKVFNNRSSCELNPRFYSTEYAEEFLVQKCFWWSQKGLINHAFLIRPFDAADKSLPVTIVLWEKGTSELKYHIDWVRRTCQTGRAVMVLDVSGVGALKQESLGNEYTSDAMDFYDVYYKVARDLIWLGDSLPALRTWDVIRALDMLQVWPDVDARDIRIYAHGRYGVYGQMAAVLDERIREFTGVEGLESFRNIAASRHFNSHDISSLVMPGLLKYFDLGDLERWRAGFEQK